MPTPALLESTTLVTPHVRDDAVRLLASYIGGGLVASRRGGRLQLGRLFETHLQLNEEVAVRLVISFEQQSLLVWVPSMGRHSAAPACSNWTVAGSSFLPRSIQNN
jgi:hypothetical protein